jgi:hypothetical protein
MVTDLLSGFRRHPKKGLPGSSPPSQAERRKTQILWAVILNVLRDLPISRNQPLKSADYYCIGILENKIKNL